MDEIISIIGKVIGAALVIAVYYLAPKVKTWLEEKIGEAKTEKLLLLIENLVTAAEQMFKEKDPHGDIRKTYVVEQLSSLGYIVDQKINAMIEAAVFELPKGGAK